MLNKILYLVPYSLEGPEHLTAHDWLRKTCDERPLLPMRNLQFDATVKCKLQQMVPILPVWSTN